MLGSFYGKPKVRTLRPPIWFIIVMLLWLLFRFGAIVWMFYLLPTDLRYVVLIMLLWTGIDVKDKSNV